MKMLNVCVFTLALFLVNVDVSEALIRELIGAIALGEVAPLSVLNLRCVGNRSNFTNFLLYTRANPDDPHTLVPGNRVLLRKSEFDPSVPTKVIIHGFLDSMFIGDWMMKMKNALLAEGDYNVILVDWSCGNALPYYQAIENSREAGVKLSNLIIFLKTVTGADPAKFHLIGHSLGSHISAVTGYRVKNLGRISALDPAGPVFYKASLANKLDPTDAAFVDVIHTDGGKNLFEGLGMYDQCGHVDFYPNGGKTQPGCHQSPFSVLQRAGIAKATHYYLSCDHYRAVYFYIESIGKKADEDGTETCEYVGVQCLNWENFSEGRCAHCSDPYNCAPMGFYSDQYSYHDSMQRSKNFYLMTSDSEPYCVYQYQVVVELGGTNSSYEESVEKINSAIHLELKSSRTGRHSRLSVNSRKTDHLTPGKKCIYLASSKFPISEVESASVWWGSETKPLYSALSTPFGLQLKKVRIQPISLRKRTYKKLSANDDQGILLCGSGLSISRDQLIDLTVGDC